MMKTYLEIGKIVGTHGIKGELRVDPWCDSPAFFKNFKTVYLAKDGKDPYKLTGARPHGNLELLTLEGICSIDDASVLRGKIVYVKRADANIEKGNYFIVELIGCTVLDADDESIVYGKISEVSQTGANDVWHIKKDDKEYLIPAIPDVVVSTDVENEIVKIHPLKGIFDEGEEIRED